MRVDMKWPRIDYIVLFALDSVMLDDLKLISGKLTTNDLLGDTEIAVWQIT